MTMPFFAVPRINTATHAMDKQTDVPLRRPDVRHRGGGEVDRFFGSWLDINQPSKDVLPATVPAGSPDGPYHDVSNPPLSIQQAIVRSLHQCLIAEIAFDPVTIPPGKDPGNWDKLAQRNLAWSDVPNPGVDAASRRSLSNFEVRATPPDLPPPLLPDELMIDWNDVPAGATASIFLPAADAAAIIETATRRYTNHALTMTDPHTIECPTGGITYVPIPAAANLHYAGLLSVDLPEGIRRGQQFSVLVQQVTNTSGFAAAGPRSAGESVSRSAATSATRSSRRLTTSACFSSARFWAHFN